MPFGGVGASGFGHYYGRHGFETLRHAKAILTSPAHAAVDDPFPPLTETKVRGSGSGLGTEPQLAPTRGSLLSTP
jgi:aldehyde dehydrogenase (NAD+)